MNKDMKILTPITNKEYDTEAHTLEEFKQFKREFWADMRIKTWKLKLEYVITDPPMVEWVYGCLSEDTEILTANGWKMLYSVFEGDYVFACDYKNDMKLQLEPVKQKFIYDYDEDAYHIKDTGYYNSELMETDHIVSKNHNVLVSESWAMDCFSNGEYPQKVAAEVLYKNVQKRKELGYKSDFHIPGLNGFIPCTIEKIPYKGKVWCVEVESGAFVARRNGKIFITGNSGFPKSLNIGKAVARLEGKDIPKEWI